MLKLDFDKVRAVFGGSLTQKQVDGLNAIVDTWNVVAHTDNRQQLADVLATAKWESAHTMQPVKETGTAKVPQPSDELVIARLNKAYAAGKLPWVKKPYWKDGWFGRGLVQLTHEFNYKGPLRNAVNLKFGVDIYTDRDATLRLDVAAFILVWGMVHGVFTGQSLNAVIDDLDESDVEDYKEFLAARKIINGTDHAADIAKLALAFEACINTVPDQVAAPKPKRKTILDLLPWRKPMTDTKQPGETVVTKTEGQLASKVNWTMIFGIIFTALAVFGINVPEDLRVQIIAVGNGVIYIIGYLINTFATPKVVTQSAKKL